MPYLGEISSVPKQTNRGWAVQSLYQLLRGAGSWPLNQCMELQAVIPCLCWDTDRGPQTELEGHPGPEARWSCIGPVRAIAALASLRPGLPGTEKGLHGHLDWKNACSNPYCLFKFLLAHWQPSSLYSFHTPYIYTWACLLSCSNPAAEEIAGCTEVSQDRKGRCVRGK